MTLAHFPPCSSQGNDAEGKNDIRGAWYTPADHAAEKNLSPFGLIIRNN